MSVTTESKLRSKYDSSSKKIKQLYEQFSAMKNNIYTPSKKSPILNKFFPSAKKGDRELFAIEVNASINKTTKNKQCSNTNKSMSLNSQHHNYFMNSCIKRLSQTKKKMDQKIYVIEERITNLKLSFEQLSILLKMKKEKAKQSRTMSCKCSQVQEILKQVQQKYDKKIEQLICSYENKISLIVKESHGQDTSDSSNEKRISKGLQDELQQLQDKLVVKEQEITNLKICNSKLRRTLDQHKVLINEKQALVNELNKEIQDKQGKLGEIYKIKQPCNACEQLKLQINKLRDDLAKLSPEKKEVQKQIRNIKMCNDKQLQDSNFLVPKTDRNESEIEKECPMVVSDEQQDDHLLTSQVKVDDEDNFEPLSHTQYFHTALRKDNYKYEQKIKQLQSQLQLIYEENNLLKTKKDKFQQQCKENEGDEQKFQMQCQILRDELKNVNISLKMLDQCAVSYMKEKKVNEEAVSKLSDSIKFKEEYLKKFPKRKIKSATKM